MSSPSSETLREGVRSLLNTVRLVNIFFVDLSMARKDGPTPAPDAQFPVDLAMGAQSTDENVAYRMTVGVERPDVSVSVSAVALYQSEQISAFQSPEIMQMFGQMVAIPALYPFARAKLQELTIDTGVGRPVLLGILDMTKAVVTPTEQSESEAADVADLGTERPAGETSPTPLA